MHRIAVLLPCLNESKTVSKVISDFRHELPHASFYVFDNGSTDETRDVALEANAIVFHVPKRGKGYVVSAMFNEIDADYYILVDADDTYPAEKVHELLDPVFSGETDMTVGVRVPASTSKAFRRFHTVGNYLVRSLINSIFNCSLTDIFSGYRVFNRQVIRTIPIVSSGFEVETEITIQMLYYRLSLKEIQVPYKDRPVGSVSKLRTFQDGIRVIWKLFSLVRACKPLTFFGGIGILLLVAGIGTGLPPIFDYVAYRYVYHVPMAILAVGLVNIGIASIFLGILLNALNWRFKEIHNLFVRRKSRE